MTLVRRPRTALVVDDSPGARRRIGTLLRLSGWRVHEAVGMEAALRQAAELDLHLVVTDMTMRRGNGPALLRALRRIGCEARFLAVSSDVTPAVRDRAAAAGAGACLAKPVEPRLLVDFLLHLPAEPIVQDEDTRVTAVRIPAERLDLIEQVHETALAARRLALARGSTGGRPALGPAPSQATSR
jgi:CheY-like chemotaxis protein